MGHRPPGRRRTQPRRPHHHRPRRADRAPRHRSRTARSRGEGRQGQGRPGAGAGRAAHGEGRHPHHHGSCGREELAAIRAWARENGHQVAAQGMVPKRIQEAYDAAHQDSARKAG
ncbi:Lsr2 family protein (plasmid) [Streptomyces cyaneofuscatus]|nr:Lsr2 family protein [Streptomyces cyaneofuscatus]